ncbi:hypothetical protein [Burkholderia pseudomallei]|uniref:hypothetical protein n=1 Tax=Burkholderia pseudomallei TaxID=28450 RepID=UPI00155FFF1D|nr:hypothetical protein [Burkholderia pseudomallei]NRE46381.1 hypothetical protein [Burkholderia pseudomallei]
MDEVKEVFFAPSIEWFKTKAKQLRLHIGWDARQYYASLNLLARIYGFVSWLDFLEYHGGNHAYETFCDSELDERTFEERRYMQTTALTSALQIGVMDAVKILDEVLVSSRREAMSDSPERNEIQDFGFALQEALDEHRESPHALNAAPAKPVVTYKKRHRMLLDVVPSRVQ